MENLRVTDRLILPASDLRLTFSRSGGPGGQHVNTTDTRVRLHFDLRGTAALHPLAKQRILEGESNRVTTEGQLVLTSDRYRSRARNLADVMERLAEIVRRHLTPPRPRKATKPSKGAKKRRLEGKKRRSSIKQGRKRPRQDD